MITESTLLDLIKKKFQIWENHNLDQLYQTLDNQGLMVISHGKVITKEDLIKKNNLKIVAQLKSFCEKP